MAKLNETREDAVPSVSFDKQTYPITSGLVLAFDHGYANPPRNVWLILKCITAELTYAVGDEVYLPPYTYTSGTTAVTVAANKTQVKIVMVTLPVITTSSGATSAITAANWDLEVRLER